MASEVNLFVPLEEEQNEQSLQEAAAENIVIPDHQYLAEPPMASQQSIYQIVLNSEVTVPTTDGVMPTTDGMMPNTDGVMPTTDGVMLNTGGMMPNTDGVLPNSDGVMPNTEGVVPGTDGVIPNTAGVIPNTDGDYARPTTTTNTVTSMESQVPSTHVAPKTEGVGDPPYGTTSRYVVLNTEGAVIGTTDVMPNTTVMPGIMPGTEGVVLITGAMPNTDISVINTEGSVPNTEVSVPNIQDTMPNTEGAVPNTTTTTGSDVLNTEGPIRGVAVPDTTSAVPDSTFTLPDSNSIPTPGSVMLDIEDVVSNTNLTLLNRDFANPVTAEGVAANPQDIVPNTKFTVPTTDSVPNIQRAALNTEDDVANTLGVVLKTGSATADSAEPVASLSVPNTHVHVPNTGTYESSTEIASKRETIEDNTTGTVSEIEGAVPSTGDDVIILKQTPRDQEAKQLPGNVFHQQSVLFGMPMVDELMMTKTQKPMYGDDMDYSHLRVCLQGDSLYEVKQKGHFCDCALISNEGDTIWCHSVIIAASFPQVRPALDGSSKSTYYISVDATTEKLNQQIRYVYCKEKNNKVMQEQIVQHIYNYWKLEEFCFCRLVSMKGLTIKVHGFLIACVWPTCSGISPDLLKNSCVIRTRLSTSQLVAFVSFLYTVILPGLLVLEKSEAIKNIKGKQRVNIKRMDRTLSHKSKVTERKMTGDGQIDNHNLASRRKPPGEAVLATTSPEGVLLASKLNRKLTKTDKDSHNKNETLESIKDGGSSLGALSREDNVSLILSSKRRRVMTPKAEALDLTKRAAKDHDEKVSLSTEQTVLSRRKTRKVDKLPDEKMLTGEDYEDQSEDNGTNDTNDAPSSPGETPADDMHAQKWFSCKLCPKQFKTKRDLKRHNKSLCTGTSPSADTPVRKWFFCKLCPHSFNSKRDLKRHRCDDAKKKKVPTATLR